MYYEDPEINKDRQYVDYCLDNNGKSIIEVESGINRQRNILSLFAKHYNNLGRKDYIGEDDIDDFLLAEGQ